MGNLVNYVDIMDYCKELAGITNVDIDTVQDIVLSAFTFIQTGTLTATRGFVYIEKELNREMEQKKATKLTVRALAS